MSEQEDFLVEIGVEELPPKSLQSLSENFAHNLLEELKSCKLAHHELEIFATPRRLAIIVNRLSTQQSDQTIERLGPFRNAAFDDSFKPTPAALGFAKSCAVSFDEVKFKETDKGERLYFLQHEKGKKTLEILAEIVSKALAKLPISKPMRWGTRNAKFVRPAHWVLMLLGNKVVPGEILEQKISNQTFGHRFHYPEAITINTPQEYAEKLEKNAFVIANFEKRKNIIRQQLENFSDKVVIDEDLLNEVTSLVEWPKALKGSFNPRFLAVPEEVLITTMKVNQKCFSMVDKNNRLLPNFVTISNIESKNSARVIKGNERVIHARLSDAEFFYQVDIKSGLDNQVKRLKDVVFQAKLGTMYDKMERIRALANWIATQIGADKNKTERAAKLCKADLMTDMVGEFPELQGTMGYYYAEKNAEDIIISSAIKEHYFPRFSGDLLPASLESCAVALADKVDTLVGIFGINQIPSGVKDPYALRRSAIGILRILIEKSLAIDLQKLLEQSKNIYKISLENTSVVTQCFDFITDRLKNYYSEQGIGSDIFAAVVARQPTLLTDFDNRINAVKHFKSLPEAQALAAANKRVSNILKKQEEDFSKININESLFENAEEKNLAALLSQKNTAIHDYFKNSNYTEALTELASLQKPVDQFFDNVMVMTEDISKRNNRLALLNSLRQMFLQIADISLLQQ